MARSRTPGTAAHTARRRPLMLEPFIKRHYGIDGAQGLAGSRKVLEVGLFRLSRDERCRNVR
jgi:hypothetical protein